MRLSLSLILVVVLAFIGLGWLFDRWYDSQIPVQENPAIESYKTLGHDLAKLLGRESLDPKMIEAWAKDSASSLQLSAYDDFPVPKNIKPNFELGEPLILESQHNISLHFFVPEKNAVLSINVKNVAEPQRISTIRWLMTFVFYTALILVLALWLYPLLKRLQTLRLTTQAFGKGDLTARIKFDSHSYIADIGQEFNRMAQQIETLVEDNKLLTRGLSHDLRTPIARLRFGLDVLQEANLNEHQQKTLDHLNRDLIAMESMVEHLLNYARLDQAKISLNFETVELNVWVKAWCQEHFDQTIEVQTCETDNHCWVDIDKYFFAQLLDNLIQNALRYGHGKVRVSINEKDSNLLLVIEDNGDGIPPEEQKNVFKPFYRVAGEKTKQGFGLGLAFVDRIAHWHKVDLHLSKSESLGGLKVSLIFAGLAN